MPRRQPDPRLADVARRRLAQLTAPVADAPTDDLIRPPQQSRPSLTLVDSRRETRMPARAPGRHVERPLGRASRLSGWTKDRLPATLQGRVRLGLAHLGVLAITVALGLAGAAWWVLRTDDGGVLVPAAAHSEDESTGGAASDGVLAASAAAVPQSPGATGVIIDVEGRVVRPGIATLPAGSRVADALAAAGGALPGTDTSSLNLARLLADGEQILVGVPAAEGIAASSLGSAPAGSSLISLNSADLAALDSLPGVGPVTAQAILGWRKDNGPFRSVDELLEVSGIGDATLAKIAPLVTL